MPIGEFIGEVLLRGVFEVIFYTFFYYTGALALWILTLGQIRLAALGSIESTNRNKNRWTDWSVWLHKGDGRKVLKAECTCLVGVFVWIAIGFSAYFATREDNQSLDKATHDHLPLPRESNPGE